MVGKSAYHRRFGEKVKLGLEVNDLRMRPSRRRVIVCLCLEGRERSWETVFCNWLAGRERSHGGVLEGRKWWAFPRIVHGLFHTDLGNEWIESENLPFQYGRYNHLTFN